MDHYFGNEILSHFKSAGLEGYARVVYEPLCACSKLMFTGKLEGNAGKNRSQRSNFLFDKYALAPIIGNFDAEVCFVAPVVPRYFVRKDRIQTLVQVRPTSAKLRVGADHWGVDAKILDLPTPLDSMW